MQEKPVIGLRREDLDKRSEERAAVTPVEAEAICALGYPLLVQPGFHPTAQIRKRAFADDDYQKAGATLQEDLSDAQIIFGLKEIKCADIEPHKTYLFFSHTHKGQQKNRPMLRELVEKGCSLLDYELITDERGVRLLTAFTYFAGYAGMIDSLWTLGRRMEFEGIDHPFSLIPQSIEKGDLQWFQTLLSTRIKPMIELDGTPASEPPLITCILGRGKTSKGAQDIYDLLPVEEIQLSQLQETYEKGSRHKLYKLVLEVYDMYRLRADAPTSPDAYADLSDDEKFKHYIDHPEQYESNLDRVLPYVSLLMNCILWSPRYPRVLPKALMAQHPETLKVIGDITCDPNGGIEFSQETWVDDPVFSYHPASQTSEPGFAAGGLQVMAVTNLPCAFAADASSQFASELAPLLEGLLAADRSGTLEDSGLPPALAKAAILWRGEFPKQYEYMKEFLQDS